MAHYRTSHGFRLRVSVEEKDGKLFLTIPPEAVALLGVTADDEVSIQALVDGGFVVKPIRATD